MASYEDYIRSVKGRKIGKIEENILPRINARLAARQHEKVAAGGLLFFALIIGVFYLYNFSSPVAGTKSIADYVLQPKTTDNSLISDYIFAD